MSEKRVVYINILKNYYQLREVDDNNYCCRRLDPTEVSDLLNEQRDQIINMKKEFEKFKEEDERLKSELNNCEKNHYNNIFEKMSKNHQNNAVTLKDVEKSIGSERYYIHCGDDINKQLFDTESDFNIHIEEVGSDEELIKLCNRLNKQQAMIEELKTYNLQHFLEWLVIKGYVADESMKDINNVIDCVDKFKEYLTVSASITEL